MYSIRCEVVYKCSLNVYMMYVNSVNIFHMNIYHIYFDCYSDILDVFVYEIMMCNVNCHVYLKRVSKYLSYVIYIFIK